MQSMSTAPKQCHYFALWIKQWSCIRTHVITDNCKKSDHSISMQLFNLTSQWRLQRPQLSQKHNVRIKSGAWNWLPPTVTQVERWQRHWNKCDVQGCRDQWCMFCTPSIAVRSTCCSQPDLNLANLEATIAAKWTLAFLSRNSTVVSILMTKLTSSLRSVVQVVMYFFYNSSVTLNVKMNCARNYENLLKFVNIMPKILMILFFSGHGVVTQIYWCK